MITITGVKQIPQLIHAGAYFALSMNDKQNKCKIILNLNKKVVKHLVLYVKNKFGLKQE